MTLFPFFFHFFVQMRFCTNWMLLYRALYSLIQFTTITLLYSFASSLGDFQVRSNAFVLLAQFCLSSCPGKLIEVPHSLAAVLVHRSVHYHSRRRHQYVCFLSITGMFWLRVCLLTFGSFCPPHDCSGSHASIPSDTSEETYCEFGLEGRVDEHRRTDYHHECRAVLGILLGQAATMVSFRLTRSIEVTDSLCRLLGTFRRRQIRIRTMIICRRRTTRTRRYSWFRASSTSSLRLYLASGHHIASRCGRTVSIQRPFSSHRPESFAHIRTDRRSIIPQLIATHLPFTHTQVG